jgi:ribosomal protein L11 methyltransferase
VSRDYPALEIRWPARPDPDHIERVLADLDETLPTAIEELPDGVRLFFAEPSHRDRAAALAADCAPLAVTHALTVADEDWAARTQAALGPVDVGSLVIAPPWAAEASQRDRDDRILIVIQPSMGFGTGHHASTRLVLSLLQELSLTGRSVLDVGTGSGVLAIAACKLGAAAVLAIDFDEDAITSADENVQLNDVGGLVRVQRLTLGKEPVGGTFDVVLANLTGAMLERDAGILVRTIAPGGRLLASGFTHDEETSVAHALHRAGLVAAGRAVEEAWVALDFGRP